MIKNRMLMESLVIRFSSHWTNLQAHEVTRAGPEAQGGAVSAGYPRGD